MKTTRTILAWGVTLAIAGVAVCVVVLNRRPVQPATPPKTERVVHPPQAQNRPSRSVRPIVLPDGARTSSSDQSASSNRDPRPSQPSDRGRGVDAQAAADIVFPEVDPEVKEGLGRLALSFVGVDPQADAVWAWAINDPNLSEEARKNLIEDLNEDGLSDPDNPTLADLPLIVSRMYLIEELAPDALDDANAEAFEEAYKDLANMYARLTIR